MKKSNYYPYKSDYMSATKTLSLVVITILLIITVPVLNIVRNVKFSKNCTAYLERASNANTVDTAKKELAIAIKYLEDNKITSGYTSIFYDTPAEDVGYWYHNLKDSYNELDKVTDETASVDKTNLLMKLRETLKDSGKDGDYLTIPKGLSKFPNNAAWAVLNIIAGILAFVGVVYLKVKLD